LTKNDRYFGLVMMIAGIILRPCWGHRRILRLSVPVDVEIKL
jgi:hypothetical protein